ncbi:MAG: YncE family protein [Parcubacteria group bacterium]|nr:YncE family protein [Parcubacteria group bacterium]
MKKWIFVIACIVLLVAGTVVYFVRSRNRSKSDEKIYVAVEGDFAISVIDASTRKVTRTIDLSVEHDGGTLPFAPHNVQVAPDGKSVWVTANAGSHQGHTSLIPRVDAHGEESEAGEHDEVIVINPTIGEIIKRIPLDVGVHAAHVVLTPDSSKAYVTAQKEDMIYKIDAKTFTIEKTIAASKKSEPHGIRIAPSGERAYIALLGVQKLGILDLDTDTLTELAVAGSPVQTAVSPDGLSVVVSLYDAKALAFYSVANGALEIISLPASAKGPIQMYFTPDSRYVYLADQGYYFSQPTSDRVYKIDLANRSIVKEIPSGQAPHGVVVSPAGRYAYVTNLLGGDVSVIDIAADTVVARIPVGKEPNGISIWSRMHGGTP